MTVVNNLIRDLNHLKLVFSTACPRQVQLLALFRHFFSPFFRGRKWSYSAVFCRLGENMADVCIFSKILSLFTYSCIYSCKLNMNNNTLHKILAQKGSVQYYFTTRVFVNTQTILQFANRSIIESENNGWNNAFLTIQNKQQNTDMLSISHTSLVNSEWIWIWQVLT